jgi:aconitate hydratase
MLPLPLVTQVDLVGRPAPGAGATDVALSLTRFLREEGVVGHVLEFTGAGLAALSLPDRAAIANMTPEYGATAGLFPVDSETLRYLRSMGRGSDELALGEAYARATGLWHDGDTAPRHYSRRLRFDLGAVVPVMSGPARPQDSLPLRDVPASIPVSGEEGDGAILIAAITSCTNTANPVLMLQAGLVAKRAVERGLAPPSHVKCSLAPGSRRIARLLEASGLLEPLEQIGFSLAGFGCTSCVGNSGPLNPAGEALLKQAPETSVVSVLSGNRNFPNRIHPAIRANYLASPPLVVVAALAGSLSVNLMDDEIGTGQDGTAVHLRDLWPEPGEAEALLGLFERTMSEPVDLPDTAWKTLPVPQGARFAWDPDSTYIRRPPFLDNDVIAGTEAGLADAHILLWLGDGVTTDHISPIGRIGPGSAAAEYLRHRALAWQPPVAVSADACARSRGPCVHRV